MYIDTSCFLKLVIPEPHSDWVAEAVERETLVIVSSLTLVESRTQLAGFKGGGRLSATELRRAASRVASLLGMRPFEFRKLSGAVFDIALEQITGGKGVVHCRTLDRLHLAAMELVGVRALLTADRKQAEAARHRGLEVRSPYPSE